DPDRDRDHPRARLVHRRHRPGADHPVRALHRDEGRGRRRACAARRARVRTPARAGARLPGRPGEDPPMSEVLVPFAIAAGIMLAISALLAVIRMVRGPSVLDRIMASDVIITVLLLTM